MVMCIIYMYTQYTLCIVCVHICNVNTYIYIYIYILCALEILLYATFMHGPSRYTHSIRGIIYRHRYMVEPLDAPEPLDADMPSRGRGRTGEPSEGHGPFGCLTGIVSCHYSVAMAPVMAPNQHMSLVGLGCWSNLCGAGDAGQGEAGRETSPKRAEANR